MKEPDDELRQAIALFSYGVIADLAHLPVFAADPAMLRFFAVGRCDFGRYERPVSHREALW